MFDYLIKNASNADDILDSLFEMKNSKGLKTDMYETEESYILKVEIAGYDKDQVSLSIEDSYLTVTLKAKESKMETEYLRNEIYTGDASRSFYVGEVTTNEVKANINDGILTIIYPKVAEASKKKYINIE